MKETKHKLCKMCYEEIDSRAKKCPHCHQWQSKLSLIVFHPAASVTVMIIVIIFVGLMFTAMLAELIDEGEDFTLYRDKIGITETELKFGECKGSPTVVVMGKIVNSSNIPWDEFQLEVRFYDSDKKLIDTHQERKYSFTVPANDFSTFKVSMPREFPEEQYVSFEMHILSAEEVGRW